MANHLQLLQRMMAYVVMVFAELQKTKTETFGLPGVTEFAVTMEERSLV